MRLSTERAELFLSDCHTRLPFRFGIHTLTWSQLITLRLEVATDAGEHVVGYSSDLLVPRWFRKDPTRTVADDVTELIESARLALEAFAGQPASVFDLWQRAYRARVEAVPLEAPDRLVRGFGVALVERALMDAACRAAGCSFFEALQRDLFAFRPREVLEELAGWDLAASLPRAPADSIALRHTVGLVDPLRARDVPDAERVRDGLPQALEEDVREYGLTTFKVKIGGTRDVDRERLIEVARVLDEHASAAPRITLDGNEQVESLEDLAQLLDEVERDPAGARLLAGLMYVEQPLPRSVTLDAARNVGLDVLSERAPVILDEADFGVQSFPRALELGYRGVSIKNCKGVFRALLNRGVAERAGAGAFQSGEDLTNLPVIALQQDLATMAALGLEHVERNGHHYFRGLDHLPPAEVEDALEAHADLYERRADGGARLVVRDGRLALGSLQCAGYGHGVAPRFAEREPYARWPWKEAH